MMKLDTKAFQRCFVGWMRAVSRITEGDIIPIDGKTLRRSHDGGNKAAIQKVNISLTTGTDFFEEIAKLRALQIILSNLWEPYSIKPNIHLHIETSNSYRSAFDSYSNLLRDTLAGIALYALMALGTNRAPRNSNYIRQMSNSRSNSNSFGRWE